MDTNHYTEVAIITTVMSTITGFISSWATAKKIRNEGDNIVNDAIAKRTQQLFDNLSKVVESQQSEIKEMKASLLKCHEQHAQTMEEYNALLSTVETQRKEYSTLIETQRKRIEALEQMLGS